MKNIRKDTRAGGGEGVKTGTGKGGGGNSTVFMPATVPSHPTSPPTLCKSSNKTSQSKVD